MASMRTLTRRLARRRRYEDRAYGPGLGCHHRGRERAVAAVNAEWRRRLYLGWEAGRAHDRWLHERGLL